MANYLSYEIKSIDKYCALIVGSGFFGITVAQQIAESIGRPVLLIERREKIGGNARSEIDSESQIEFHLYGPHIFHTSNEKVWQYVNRFTEFNDYRHHVWADVGGELFSLPISLATMSQFWGRRLSPEQARQLVNKSLIKIEKPRNFEEKALATIGKELYEAFFKGYTQKQWQTNPKELPASVFGRIPFRYTMNTRYFNDKYEGIPTDGFGSWIDRIVLSDLIDIKVSTDWKEVEPLISKNMPVVYTGPIDEFFNYKYGRLGWRTLDFDFACIENEDFQGTSQINYPGLGVSYTRSVEYKHFRPNKLGNSKKLTIVSKEYSRFATENDEPFYPINTQRDVDILSKYRAEAMKLKNVHFGGRLGSYQYLDMHMAIASALIAFSNQIKPSIINWLE